MSDPAAQAAAEGEMDDAMEDMEGMDPEENGMDEDEDGDDADAEKNEYQKKELIARPWHSESLAQTIKEVEGFEIKNQR